MSRAFEQFLYHGTIFRIDRIDVGCGRRRKDFGRGFYMAFRPDQAIGMMHKKHREAERRSRNHELPDLREYLYRIRLNPTVEERLAVKVFETADMEWLEFILSCRESAEKEPTVMISLWGQPLTTTLFCLYKTIGRVFMAQLDSLSQRLRSFRLLSQRILGFNVASAPTRRLRRLLLILRWLIGGSLCD